MRTNIVAPSSLGILDATIHRHRSWRTPPYAPTASHVRAPRRAPIPPSFLSLLNRRGPCRLCRSRFRGCDAKWCARVRERHETKPGALSRPDSEAGCLAGRGMAENRNSATLRPRNQKTLTYCSPGVCWVLACATPVTPPPLASPDAPQQWASGRLLEGRLHRAFREGSQGGSVLSTAVRGDASRRGRANGG